MTGAPPYVVPGRRLLLAVHVRDPNVPKHHTLTADSRYPGTGATQLTRDSHDGQTICGRPMLAEDQWVDFPPEHVARERVCPDCLAGDASFVEEAMF